MPPEGMVHALREIHRVLASGGYLADVRPHRGAALAGNGPAYPQVYVLRRKSRVGAGILEKEDLEEHRAATRAVRRVVEEGGFGVVSAETFPFRWYFRSLSLLEDYLRTRWDTTYIEPGTYRTLKRMARIDPRAQILIEDTFQLNILRKR